MEGEFEALERSYSELEAAMNEAKDYINQVDDNTEDLEETISDKMTDIIILETAAAKEYMRFDVSLLFMENDLVKDTELLNDYEARVAEKKYESEGEEEEDVARIVGYKEDLLAMANDLSVLFEARHKKESHILEVYKALSKAAFAKAKERLDKGVVFTYFIENVRNSLPINLRGEVEKIMARNKMLGDNLDMAGYYTKVNEQLAEDLHKGYI